MKKMIALALTAVMALAPASSVFAEDMRVAMITDYGDITDQSFNQTTYEAAKAYCEANGVDFTYYKPEGDSTADRVAMVDKAVMDGYDVLIMPGYAFGGTIVETSEMYPDTKIIALDVAAGDILGAALGDSYDYNPDNWDVTEYYAADNVYCAVYQEELCGYMAGVAAVKLGYTKLGFLGGMAVPAVMRYGYGFVQGADDAAAELGAEVVFACGGGIYTSAAEAAEKTGGKVIGVDVDQKGIIDGAYGEGMTVTSAMKGLAATVETLLTAIADDKWSESAGKIETLGLVSGDDPSVNFVQIPMESTQWSDSFTQDDYKQLVADMYSGAITVSNDISAAEPAAETAKVNFLGNLK